MSCNEEKIENKVDRKFNDREQLEVVISDLTYVRVRDKWCYICILIDLFNREIIGYSAGAHKDAQLVYDAFLSSSVSLARVKIFHTDRGNEFKNKIIDDLIHTFKITRSLSHKGCPYDNAVAEATYKIFKTDFVMNKQPIGAQNTSYALKGVLTRTHAATFSCVIVTAYPLNGSELSNVNCPTILSSSS